MAAAALWFEEQIIPDARKMLDGYKIVCVTPAGRRRYLRLLIPYVLSCTKVDRYDLWINTPDPAHVAFLEAVASVDDLDRSEVLDGYVRIASERLELEPWRGRVEAVFPDIPKKPPNSFVARWI